MTNRQPWRRWAVQAAIVAAPLAYGTVHPLPTTLFEMSGYLLFGWWALGENRATNSWGHLRDPLLLLGFAGILLGILQLIPLPVAWLSLLSSGTATLVREALELQGTGSGGYHSMAVVPLVAENGLLWLTALVAWYAVIQSEVQDRRGARRIVQTLALTGLGIAMLGLAQALTKTDAIYWIGIERETFYATFVNPNNAAGVLTLATAACLGMAYTMRGEFRFFWFLGALLTSVSTIFSLSRGGMGILAFCLLFTAWFAVSGARGAPGKPMGSPVGLFVLFAGIFAFVLWIGSTEVIGELESVQHDPGLNGRTEIWRTTLTGLWPSFPVFGVGFGNFAEVYPIYSTTPAKVHVSAAENEYLQILAEGGLIGFSLLAIAVGIGVRRAVTALRNVRRIGMTVPLTAGLTAIALHMLLDFPLRLGGPALWILTFVALVCGRPQGAAAAAAAAPRLMPERLP